jgi:hypothetical protein
MTRFAVALALAVITSAATAVAAFAQAAPSAATPASNPPPAARARWVAPIKGDAAVQIIKSESKRSGKEIVTNFKVKNVSSGAIALLRIDEYWYDNNPKPTIVTADTQRWMKPILPGEIVEMTTRAPAKPGATRSQWTFSHANGKVVPKMVKKFD